jgi:hypothetical protein
MASVSREFIGFSIPVSNSRIEIEISGEVGDFERIFFSVPKRLAISIWGIRSLLTAAGVKISMDGRGRWMDNVFIERLWRSFKYQDVYLKGYADGLEASAV